MKRAKFNVSLQSLFDKLLPQFAEADLPLRTQLAAVKPIAESTITTTTLPDNNQTASTASVASTSSPTISVPLIKLPEHTTSSASSGTPAQSAVSATPVSQSSTPQTRDEQITVELIPLPQYECYLLRCLLSSLMH
jgi:hypothetical protein